MLNIASWNVNGWTNNNSILREEIIKCLNCDIICLSETHLTAGKNIEIPGYTWRGNNRRKHVNAVKGSGGVGILFKDHILETQEITYMDKSMEGIITMNLKDKHTDFEILIICGYLPPENSPHSRNSTDFFAYILTQLYMNYDADFVLVCGDFNCRTGSLQDIIIDIDDIPLRDILDEQKNNFGDNFIDFLNDSKLCMLNGRICKEYNNFTSISTKGKAVVDYMLTFHDCLNKCKLFKVNTMSNIIDNFNLYRLISEQCKPPDHSILTVSVDCMHGFLSENIQSTLRETDTNDQLNKERLIQVNTFDQQRINVDRLIQC